MKPLPTLGGANGYANMINNRGDVVGWAENNTQDLGCTVFQFKPVVWRKGQTHELPTTAGDPNGAAIACTSFSPRPGQK